LKNHFTRNGLWFAGRALAALAGAALLAHSVLTTAPAPTARNEAAPTTTSAPATSKTTPTTKPSTTKKNPPAGTAPPSTTDNPRPAEQQPPTAGDAGDTGGAEERICADNDPQCGSPSDQ